MTIKKSSLHSHIVNWTFFVAALSTMGSLFFSEVMKLPPCVLCWYQRIAMYPIFLIVLVGTLLKDLRLGYYVLALAIPGFFISIYHNLLYYNIIPESLSPCVQGISCTTRQIEWMGFITIPLMSLTGFALIIFPMLYFVRSLYLKESDREK